MFRPGDAARVTVRFAEEAPFPALQKLEFFGVGIAFTLPAILFPLTLHGASMRAGGQSGLGTPFASPPMGEASNHLLRSS